MYRRDFTKTVVSLPFIATVPTTASAEDCEEEEVLWDIRGVWRRKDDTGYLAVQEGETELKFEQYNNWVSTTLQRLSKTSDISSVVDLFDFRLISVYSGDYARTHFAHEESGLEVTIKRNPDEEVEFSAFVTHIEEPWEEHREYASSSQIRIAQKLKQERDEYL